MTREISRTGTMEPLKKRKHSIPRFRCDQTMTSKTENSKWRKRKTRSPNRDDDCSSLAWLLKFRLDDLIHLEPEEYEVPQVHEPPALRKPPYTYPELIERALRENGELTVSAIYQWISDRFPYYKANDERWKNSVRHNLSINPHFRKGARAPQGAGHLWSLAANAIDLLPNRANLVSPVYEKPKVDDITVLEFPKVIVLDEAAFAAASILPDQDIFSGGTMFLNPISSEQIVRECGLLVMD